MSKAKIFKIHFTIGRKAEQNVRYKAVPVPLMVIAKNYERALEIAQEEVREFLKENNAFIKATRHSEIKVLKVINDFKNNKE